MALSDKPQNKNGAEGKDSSRKIPAGKKWDYSDRGDAPMPKEMESTAESPENGGLDLKSKADKVDRPAPDQDSPVLGDHGENERVHFAPEDLELKSKADKVDHPEANQELPSLGNLDVNDSFSGSGDFGKGIVTDKVKHSELWQMNLPAKDRSVGQENRKERGTGKDDMEKPSER